jgi:hypothetical protein
MQGELGQAQVGVEHEGGQGGRAPN